ncbi:MAG TPA: GNAT family N-acetyltransferase [Mycobacteriales bacterium]|nr:GNAT family N-acetyltransferase [Mycobacteriales bacterium]
MTRRPARPEDAEAVLDLWHRHQSRVLGHRDSTADDARDLLGDPDLDTAVVVEEGGRLVACALLLQAEGSGHADLDVVVDPDAGAHLLAPLLQELLDRAAARAGAEPLAATQACYRQDAVTARVLEGLGLRVATTFHRMRRELDAPVEVAVPHGVEVLPPAGAPDEEVLRRTHRLHQQTFAGHDGFVAKDWDAWLEAHRARSDPGLVWLARVDGDDAGFLHETDQFVEDEGAGYVWRLGVRREARGRGVARALLLSSFAAVRDRGRSAALLHVDTANATGATRLYEGVGMRPVLVLDMWRTPPAPGSTGP